MINAPDDARKLFFSPTTIGYEKLLEWFEVEIAHLTKGLIETDDETTIHRLQGGLRTLKDIKKALSKGVSGPRHSAINKTLQDYRNT